MDKLTLADLKAKKTVTLEDLKACDSPILPPVVVAKVIGVTAYWINITVRDAPQEIPFPFLVTGKVKKCVKIPTAGLIRWLEGKEATT